MERNVCERQIWKIRGARCHCVRAQMQRSLRTALKERVRRILRSRKAKIVAKNQFYSLRKICQIVKKNLGAASGR